MSLFGMSSLDLFASALGAFILISIIIFPLIADTSRSDPAEPIPLLAAVSCPEPIVCPVCPAVTTPAPAPAPVVAAAPETPPGRLRARDLPGVPADSRSRSRVPRATPARRRRRRPAEPDGSQFRHRSGRVRIGRGRGTALSL